MKKLRKMTVHSKFKQVKELWKSVIIGELNNQLVKIVKVQGKSHGVTMRRRGVVLCD